MGRSIVASLLTQQIVCLSVFNDMCSRKTLNKNHVMTKQQQLTATGVGQRASDQSGGSGRGAVDFFMLMPLVRHGSVYDLLYKAEKAILEEKRSVAWPFTEKGALFLFQGVVSAVEVRTYLFEQIDDRQMLR